MKDIPDKTIDICVTDIPYGEVNRKSKGDNEQLNE